MDVLIGVLRGWFSQDVARRNAAQAAVRLQHRRRERESVEAFLATHHHDLPWQAVLTRRSFDIVDVRRPRPGTL